VSARAAPLVIAHRGASGERPENTLSAYELAVAQGADMIEIDLHRSADGETVITHDADLVGLGGKGEVAETPVAVIRSLDAGGGEVVPTLDEVLDGFGSRIPFNLELKRGRRSLYADLVEVALEAVERRGLLERTLFSSFDDPVLAELRDRSPRARLALLISPRSAQRPLERAHAVGAEAINPWRSQATAAFIDAAHRSGLAVHVYTVDAETELRRLIDAGVDGIFTNFPARLRRILLAPRGPRSDPNESR